MTQHSGALVQGSYGKAGNFELVLPAPNGEGLVHYSRDNDDTPERWGGPSGFGTQPVEGVALIQGDFGLLERNLEVVACEGGALVHYWRDDPSFIWYRRMTPIATGVRGTPGFIQRPSVTHEPDGSIEHADFEVVVPLAAGGLAHWRRDNRHPDLVWEGPDIFGKGIFDAVALTQSNFVPEDWPIVLPQGKVFRPEGNLEVVARQGDQLLHFHRDEETGKWSEGEIIPIPERVTGTPVLIQSTFGRRGDFVLIVPLAGGGLAHWKRGNDHKDLPWEMHHAFPGEEMSIVGLVQGNFGRRGNLELVVRAGSSLQHYWFDTGYAWKWSDPDLVAIEHVRTEAEAVYGWTAAYLQEGTRIIVRIEAVPGKGVDPDELEAAKARWRKGILDAWNCGCRCLTARGAAGALTFEVEWVKPGDDSLRRPFNRSRGEAGHHRVKVLRRARRATLYTWTLHTPAAVAAHEFGHMLGLADEYESVHAPNRFPVNTGTIMDVEGGRVEPRLVEHLCAPMCNQAAHPAPLAAAAASP